VAVRGLTLDEQTRADVARAFQDAVVETLVAKCERALKYTQAQTLVVAGGVGANRELRAQLLKLGARLNVSVSYPRPEFCTDNAAMIAYAGYLRLTGGERESLPIRARARWPIDQLLPPQS
jgi:N6-L-threonylcarbamoyladenine synthase